MPKLYSVKIFDGDKLIKHFVPEVASNGDVSMHEIINDGHYKVSGSINHMVRNDNSNITSNHNTQFSNWYEYAKFRGAKFKSFMRPNKVYLYAMYSETFVEFDNIEIVESVRKYCDENIPYWDYDPVYTFDLNDPKQLDRCMYLGWVKEDNIEVN